MNYDVKKGLLIGCGIFVALFFVLPMIVVLVKSIAGVVVIVILAALIIKILNNKGSKS